MDIKYFTENDYKTLGNLAYKSWNENKLDITIQNKYWMFENCSNNKIYNYVKKYMKIKFPHLIYVYDYSVPV